MSNNSTTTSIVDLSVIFADRPLKYFAVISVVVMIVIFVTLCIGIIWFERFGSDLIRILTNRLVTCICWCLVEIMIFLCLPDIVLYFYRPFPEWICYLQVILRNSLIIRLIFLFDAIIRQNTAQKMYTTYF